MFSILCDASAILFSKGVYKQAKVYKREGSKEIYVGHGSGFIRLSADGATSVPDLKYEDLVLPFTPEPGQFKRPLIPKDYK